MTEDTLDESRGNCLIDIMPITVRIPTNCKNLDELLMRLRGMT